MAAKSALPTITGVVVRGAGRGKELGFPTANLQLSDATERPLEGIYAAWVTIGAIAHKYSAAVHVGPAPTFNRTQSIIEVHLLNFPPQDLYGAKLTVTLVQKIREVQKFSSATDLITAIKKDCATALSILGNTTAN